MSDEQTIYIGPEDDLTSVRERLENIQSRRVTLVIPAQTQLRSHVAWKLLHARARELSKDVLIVSSDPQIRSVAQAVKFKVAHSLESSPISRSRPGNRSGRSNPPNRGRMSGRGGPEARSSRNLRPRPTPSPEQPRQWKPTEQVVPTSADSTPSSEDETTTGGLSSLVPSDNDAARLTSFSQSERKNEPHASPIFDLPEKQTPRPHDFSHGGTTPPVTPAPATPIPPIHPLSREQIDEEPDLLLEDFHVAQDIRRAASPEATKKPEPKAEPPIEELSVPPPTPQRSGQLPSLTDDPFSAMEDDSRPPVRSEQRGGVSLESSDTTEQPVQDIVDIPTSVLDHDIEDMGDQGAFEIFSDNEQPITRHDWEDEVHTAGPVRESEQERERRERRGRQEPSTRGSRSGSLKKTSLTPQKDFESEDALPPVEERSPRVIPPPSSPLTRERGGTSVTPARPAASAANRPGAPTTRGRPGLSRPQPRTARERPVRTRGGQPSRAGRVAARQRNLGAYVSIAIIVLILLLVGALAYFIPSARVTVTLPSRTYSHAVSLKAVPKGQQVADGSVVGEVLTRNFTKNGAGNATGTAKVNNQSASGSVLFTNNSTVPVTIPTGVIVATNGANGQQFKTTANAVVLSPSNNNKIGNTTEIPIQAVKPGPAGNVPRGAITVIPDDSLSQIVKATGNIAASDLKLSVSNEAATTGGGAANATVVSRKDLDTTTKNLQDSLKSDIDAWVKQQKVDAQDIVGQPQITSSLVKPPAEGTVENSGTFPAQLSATVTLMIIRHAALQDATIQQLNGFLAKDKAYANSNYVISRDARQPVQFQNVKQNGQGTNLTLNFTALAHTIPNMTAEQVQKLVAGKQIPDATRQLKTLKDVQSVSIEISPGFVPWVTSWAPNINVVFVPGTAPAPPKK